jgi:hypothetical protein
MEPSQMDCPVKKNFEKTLLAVKEFGKAMRSLRRTQSQCDRCPTASACPLQQQVGQAIEEAVLEIAEEWGLGREFDEQRG